MYPAGSGSRKVHFYHFKITNNSLFSKDNNEIFRQGRILCIRVQRFKQLDGPNPEMENIAQFV